MEQITCTDLLKKMLLTGSKITKFDFLQVTSSVCLAQRILELRQSGWNIDDEIVKGKGTLKCYFMHPEEIKRIRELEGI